MKEYWEDSHTMYEEDDKKIHWRDFIGGLVICSMIFFCGYGIYAFFHNLLCC